MTARSVYRRFLYPVLQHVDAEDIHNNSLFALRLLKYSPFRFLVKSILTIEDPRLQSSLGPLHFANPIGLAAGFDKNGVAGEGLSALGFGHIEVGTVTPRPQHGKPKPRLFRLSEDDALINRMGFSNWGMESLAIRLAENKPRDYVLGINIGANATTVEQGDALSDYIACFERLACYADYITINISSPNTPGLRLLQGQKAIDTLLQSIFAVHSKSKNQKPVLIKVAPDLPTNELNDFLDVVATHPVSGLIATNTTLSRPASLRSASKGEAGGLSGSPLKEKSTEVIRSIYTRTHGAIPIIGVGGISTATDVIEKMRAGASLVQLYTGFIYLGPTAVRDLCTGLVQYMDQHNIATISDIIGQS